jgi:hypothetical protein
MKSEPIPKSIPVGQLNYKLISPTQYNGDFFCSEVALQSRFSECFGTA